MAITMTARASTEALHYDWMPPLVECDSIASVVLSISAGAATLSSYDTNGDSVSFVLAGGDDGETTVISATVVTSEGETIAETIYVPVRTRDIALGYTARDIGGYALRKIVGNGNTAEAVELDDVLERLSDMLASWAGQGADLGVKLPVTANDTLYIPDEFAWGVKNNLIVAVFSHYGEPIPPETVMYARQGLQQIKTTPLSGERQSADYF